MDGLGFKDEQRNLSKADTRSREELAQILSLTETELIRVLRENYALRNLKIADDQLKFLMKEQLESLKQTQFGSSSERYKKPVKSPEEPKAPPRPRVYAAQ